MHPSLRSLLVAAALAGIGALPAAAQQTAAATATAPVVNDLLNDVAQVERKFLALARAIPAEKYDWRPGDGVRSVAEVFKHVTSDNYFIPAMAGVPADPATGITGGDYKTAAAFEQRQMSRDSVIAALEKSFAHLKQAMSGTTADRLDESVNMFGRSVTLQQTWILATTHLHEHLGQSIAYARTNGIVPPWSQ